MHHINHPIDAAEFLRDMRALAAAVATPEAANTEQMSLQLGTLARIDAALRDGESRADLLRVAVEHELKRREYSQQHRAHP